MFAVVRLIDELANNFTLVDQHRTIRARVQNRTAKIRRRGGGRRERLLLLCLLTSAGHVVNLLGSAVRTGVARRGRLLAMASRLFAVVVLAMIAIVRLTSHRCSRLFVGEIGCLSILIACVRGFLQMIEFAHRMATVLGLIVIDVVMDVAQRMRVIVVRLNMLIVGLGRFLACVVDAAIAQTSVARTLGILPVVGMDRLK